MASHALHKHRIDREPTLHNIHIYREFCIHVASIDVKAGKQVEKAPSPWSRNKYNYSSAGRHIGSLPASNHLITLIFYILLKNAAEIQFFKILFLFSILKK